MKTLRERMIVEMQFRNYSKRTIDAYVGGIARLSKHFRRSPDKISINEIKDYLHQLVMVEKCSFSLFNQTINAVRILFKDVLERPWKVDTLKRPKKKGVSQLCFRPKKQLLLLMPLQI